MMPPKCVSRSLQFQEQGPQSPIPEGAGAISQKRHLPGHACQGGGPGADEGPAWERG